MSQWVSHLRSYFFSQVNCEAPPAPDEKKPEEPPIVFDETENPAQQELARKHPMRPPSFEALLQNFRVATMIEPLDGLKVDFGMGLSPRLQFSNSWSLPQGQPGNYELTLVYVGGQMSNNPMEMTGPNPLLMSRWTPSVGRQDLKLICTPKEAVEVRLNGNYMSFEPRESQVQVEADYKGDNFVGGAKVGIGLEFLSYHYTQSLTRNLAVGFELMNMKKPQPMLGLSFGGKYNRGDNQFFLQYLTYSKSVTFGALIKGNKNITFSSEFTYNKMSGESEFSTGFAVRFSRAKFQALVSGTGKISAVLQHAVNAFSKLSLNAEADLVKQDQKFGIAVSFGSA